ncbi:hypothetical protein SH449x_004710 [Pirellulaceae bacterium SH449]
MKQISIRGLLGLTTIVAFVIWCWLSSVRQYSIESDLEVIQYTDHNSKEGQKSWLHTAIARFRSTGEVCCVFVEEVPIVKNGKHRLPVGVELVYMPGRMRLRLDGEQVDLSRGVVFVHCRNIGGREASKRYSLNSTAWFSTDRVRPVTNLDELFDNCLNE